MQPRLRNRGGVMQQLVNAVNYVGKVANNYYWVGRDEQVHWSDTYARELYVTVDDRETMADVTKNFNGFNSVSHSKLLNYPFPAVSARVQHDFGEVTPAMGILHELSQITVPGFYASIPALGGYTEGGVHFPDIDWSGMVAEVGSRLDGSMKNSANLLVSVAEVGQTIGMLKNPMNLKNLRKLAGRGKTLSSVAKISANSWLEYKYGWKNLASDIRALARVYSEASKHQEFLRQTRAKFTGMSSSQRDVCPLSISLSGPSGSDSNSFGYSAQLTRAERTAVFSLDIRRRESDMIWSKNDLVMQRLGVNQMVEALWDLVPFSFVVDWFVHIDRMVKTNPAVWASWDLRNVGYSTKTCWYARGKTSCTASISTGSNYAEAQGPDFCFKKQYGREPGFPGDTIGVGLFGRLSYSNMLDGAALIVQRI